MKRNEKRMAYAPKKIASELLLPQETKNTRAKLFGTHSLSLHQQCLRRMQTPAPTAPPVGTLSVLKVCKYCENNRVVRANKPVTIKFSTHGLCLTIHLSYSDINEAINRYLL